MNAVPETYSATLLEVLAEVSALLEDCSQIAGHLEHAIGEWLSKGAVAHDFPVVELQSIDLLRQIQHDLSSLLSSEELAQEITRNQNRVDIASVISTPKLERVRNRLLQLAKGKIELVGPLPEKDAPQDSGLVDLF